MGQVIPMNPDHLLCGVARDIERWVEDALGQMAHELEAEALLKHSV